jgi:hypothetical protein
MAAANELLFPALIARPPRKPTPMKRPGKEDGRLNKAIAPTCCRTGIVEFWGALADPLTKNQVSARNLSALF